MNVLPDPHKSNGWTVWHFVGAVALAAVGVYLARDVWADIFRMAAHDDESSHIFLVGVAAPWLVLAGRDRFAHCRPRGLWVGPLLVAVGWASLIYGYDHRYESLWHGGAVLIAAGCALSLLGRDVLIRFLPAFLVLAFLIPVPGRVRAEIGIPMQTAMAFLTEHIGQVLGFVINRAGNVLIVNDHRIEVAEACNGMRMIFALFLVAYTFAFATPLRFGVRALILVAAPLFALLCNVIRMIPTVWLYGYASEELADRFHDISGWVMIIAGLFLLMGMVKLLRWARVPVLRDEAAAARIPGALPWGPLLRPVLTSVATGLLLAGFTATLQPRQMPEGVARFHDALRDEAEHIPPMIGEWYGRDVEVPAVAVRMLRPNVLISRRYQNLRTGEAVTLVLVQTRDARSLAHHYPPICYPNSGWAEQWRAERDWSARGREIPLMEYGFKADSFADAGEIVIANFMLLPTGRTDRGMGPIYALAGDPFMRFFGAAQFQLIFDAATPPQDRESIFGTFVADNLPLLEKMLEGVNHDSR